MKPAPAPKAKLTSVAEVIPRVARPAATIPSFDGLPDSAYVREAQLVPSPKRPGALVPLPFSAPTLWRMVKNSTFPKPYSLSERVTAWKVGDIRAWMAAQTSPTQQRSGRDDEVKEAQAARPSGKPRVKKAQYVELAVA